MGHALFGVVDHHGKLVGVQPVGPPNDEIPDIAREILALPALQPVDVGDLLVADAHPQRMAHAGSRAPFTVAAGAGIDAFAAGAPRCRLEIGARAGAGIHGAVPREPRHGIGIQRIALRLAHDRPVGREAVPRQRGHDVALGPGARARDVDVLDANQPLATRGARVGTARERRDQRAEMQRAGGGGSEASAVRERARGRFAHRSAGVAAFAVAASPEGASPKWRRVAAMTAFGYSGRPRLPL